MPVQDLLRGCGWIWVPFAALCLLIQPGAVPRWGRVALHSGCPLLLALQGPALASGNARKLELSVCSGEKMLSEVKVVP